MQYLEEFIAVQSKVQTQTFAARDPIWQQWILKMVFIIFATLLSPPNTPHPAKGGPEISWAPSMAESFLDSAVSSIPCRVWKGVADCISSH